MTQESRTGRAATSPVRRGRRRDRDEVLAAADAALTAALSDEVAAVVVEAEVADADGVPALRSTPPALTARQLTVHRRVRAAVGLGTVALVGVGLVATAVLGLWPPMIAIAYVYVFAPALLIAAWVRGGGSARWSRDHRPRTLAGWADQVADDGRALRGQAKTLRRVRREVGDLRRRARTIRALCPAEDDPGLGGLAAALDDLHDHLTLVRHSLRVLASRIDRAGRAAEGFAAAALRDPSAACHDFGPVFLAIDPEPVATLRRSTTLPMRLSRDASTAIPSWAERLSDDPESTPPARRAAGLENELRALLGETLRCSQESRRTSRYLLDDANGLHTAATAEVIGGLDIAPFARASARLALQLSPWSHDATRTTTVRAAFARRLADVPGASTTEVWRAAGDALVRARRLPATAHHL